MIAENPVALAPAPVVLMLRPDPMRSEWTRCEYPHGASLAEMLASASDDWVAWVDGVKTPRDTWPACRPAPGALVTLVRAPGEPISTTIGLTTLLSTSFGISMGTAGIIGGMMVSSVISFGLNMVMNALISPQTPSLGRSGAASTRYSSLTSGQNRANPFGPLPRLYGRCRIYPPLAANYYSVSDVDVVGTGPHPYEITASHTYLYVLLCLSYGPLSIGGTKVGPKLLTSGNYSVYDDPQKPNGVPLSPAALQHINKALPVKTIRIGDTDIANYNDVQWEIGARNQITLYKRDVHEAQLNISLPKSGDLYAKDGSPAGDGTAIAIQTTEADTVSAQIDFQFPALFATDDNGVIVLGSALFGIEWRVTNGGNTWASIASAPTAVAGDAYGGAYNAEARSQNPIRQTVTFQFPQAGTYDIRVRRLYSGLGQLDPRPGQYSVDAFWTCLRSFKAQGTLPYLHDQSTVMALKIKSSGQLNGVLDTLNILATAVVKVWDGTQWTEEGNRNPAWAFFDALTGPQMAKPVAESQIDKAALKAWADECWAADPNDPNYHRTYNWYHQDSETLLDRLRAIARCGRAEWALRDTRFTVVRDTNDAPIQVISPRNAWGFRMSKTFAPRPHALRVRYVAGDAVADNGTITPGSGEQTERIVLDDGYQIDGKDAWGNAAPGLPAATRFDVLETQGVDNADQAFKEGRYHLAQLRLRPEVWSVQMDAENLVATRGDTVRLAYDVIMVGLAYGRVKSLVGNTLVLDEEVAMASGKTYAVRLRKSDGSSAVVGVTTVAGTTHTLTLATSPAGYFPGDLAVFGESGIESVAAKVLSIEYAPDLSATLKLTPAAMPDLLDADSGPIPPYNPAINGSIENRAPPVPRLTAVASDKQDLESNSAGLTTAGVRVAWVVQASDVSVDTVEVKIYPATAGAFQEVVLTLPADAGACAFHKLPLDTPAFVTARSHSVWGKWSSWCEPWGLTTVSAAAAPEPAGRYLILSASATQFTYDGHGQPAPAGQSITLTVKTSRLDSYVPSWTATAYNASGQVLLPAPTLGGTGATRTLTVADFGAADHVEITASQGGKSDTVTIARAKDGKSAVHGSLTKASAMLATDSDGNGYSLADAAGTFEVLEGEVYKSNSGQVAFSAPYTDGMVVDIDASGNYSVTSLTADTAKAKLRAVYANGDVNVTLDRWLVVAKSRRGLQGLQGNDGTNGTNGTNGSNAQTLTLSSTAQAFTYGKRGVASPLSQVITLTANPQNLTGTATFTATNYDSNGASLGQVVLGGSGNTRTLTRAPGNDQFGNAAYCVVTATLGGFSDTITVVRLQDGLDTVVGVLTNESALVAADKDGNVANFNNAGGTFRVWEGTTEITTGNGVAYSVASYSGLTIAINATTGVYSVSAMSADEGIATLRASYSGQALDKVYSIAKAKVGATGAQGSRAQAIRLSATSHAFTYDKGGAASPTSQTISISADLQNVNGSTAFTAELFNISGGSLGQVTLGGSGNTRTLTNTQFGSSAYAVITAQISGDSGVLSDVVRVIRVKDGADGVAGGAGAPGQNAVHAWLTNRAAVVAADVNGNVVSFANAGGTFRLFDGLTEKTTSGSVNYSIASSSNVSITIGSNGAYSIVELSADYGTATLRASYGNVNYDEIYTIAKARVGATGAAGGQGIQGNPGTNAQSIDLVASAAAFLYAPDNTPYPTSQIIRVDCAKQNTLASPTFAATLFDSGNVSMGAMSITQAGDTCWLNISNFNINSAYVQVSCTVNASSGTLSKYLQINKTPAWRQRYSGYLESAAYTTQAAYSWYYRSLFTSGVVSSSASAKCKAVCSARFSMDAAYWSGCGVDVWFGVWDVTGNAWLYSGATLNNRTNGADYHQEIQFTLPAGHQAQPYLAFRPNVSGGTVTCIYGYGAVEEIQ